ncbi:transporter substrate-binding domain-containing protein [Pseudoalteromonas luteoviolacea]|nr:transporter substrate-binding domain-containing protein [Pseudoalteromonas luteoviolacea]
MPTYIGYILGISLFVVSIRIYGDEQTILLAQPITQPTIYSSVAKEVLLSAYAQIDESVTFELYPAKRALRIADKGLTDGLLARTPGLEQDYPNLRMLSVPVAFEKVYLFTNQRYVSPIDWRELTKYRVAAVRGFMLVAQSFPSGILVEVSSIEQAFYMLSQHKVDFVIDLESGECSLKKLGLSEIRKLEPAMTELIVYHYLHENNKALMTRVEPILRKMETQGKIKAIYQKVNRAFNCDNLPYIP